MRGASRFWLFSGAALVLAGCGSSSLPQPGGGGGSGCGFGDASIATVRIANSGRKLSPIGRMTAVGDFPTGGRLSPGGRFYWSLSAGHGQNDVHVVNVATGNVSQVLPLPGSYGQM